MEARARVEVFGTRTLRRGGAAIVAQYGPAEPWKRRSCGAPREVREVRCRGTGGGDGFGSVRSRSDRGSDRFGPVSIVDRTFGMSVKREKKPSNRSQSLYTNKTEYLFGFIVFSLQLSFNIDHED